MAALQGARRSVATSKRCPSCNAQGTTTETPRSIKCSNCGWGIDLTAVRSADPVLLREQLLKQQADMQRIIMQIKYDTVYRELDMKQSYEILQKKHAQVLERLAEVQQVVKRGTAFVLLPPAE